MIPIEVQREGLSLAALRASLSPCAATVGALIQNTGKGGAYRYYCCSRKLRESVTACRGFRMPMDRLDEIVVGEVAKRVLEPNPLGGMLQAYVRAGSDREDQNRERLAKLRHAHKEAEAAIARLLELVEKGLMDAEDPALRERLIGLKLRRDELAKDAGGLQRRIASGEPQVTPDKIGKVARPSGKTAPRPA